MCLIFLLTVPKQILLISGMTPCSEPTCFFFSFIYLFTLHYCIGFDIHWHESQPVFVFRLIEAEVASPRKGLGVIWCTSWLWPVGVSVSFTLYCRFLLNGEVWEQNRWWQNCPIPFATYHFLPPLSCSCPRFLIPDIKVIKTKNKKKVIKTRGVL